MKQWIVILALLMGFCGSQIVQASGQSWHIWLNEFKQEAMADGISEQTFDSAFDGVKPSRRVTHFDKTQPEKRITFQKYRRTRIDPYRITLGVREFKKRRDVLEKIGQEYGVDPCFVTAFWGIESSYGRYLGNFPVISSLATLAYDGRRTEFFRKELLYALHILQDGHVNPERFKGEWAGASGHAQFLPSSWHKFAVDYNGDGHKDIWNDLHDVFASIANYMKQNGWRAGEPWGYEVSLPPGFDESLKTLKQKRPVSEWRAMGVRLLDGRPLPDLDLDASIIEPFGGPAFIAFNNYKVIMRYNNSIFYAGSVGYLADSICRKVGRGNLEARVSDQDRY